jgi:hypothetical protein
MEEDDGGDREGTWLGEEEGGGRRWILVKGSKSKDKQKQTVGASHDIIARKMRAAWRLALRIAFDEGFSIDEKLGRRGGQCCITTTGFLISCPHR